VAILDCFRLNQPALGVREVARQLDLSHSTVGRIMAYLKELGILNQDPESQLYMMGPKVLAWAGIYTVSSDVRTLALPIMVDLQDATRETISLYILEGTERVCIERLESPETVRIVQRVGRRIPLYAGSAGKVFLAYMAEALRERILKGSALLPMTENTITDAESLREDLRAIQQRGYAISKGEWIIDAAGVAAPIFNQVGQITAALSISGPIQRFKSPRIKELGELVKTEAKKVSQELGYYVRA